LTKFAQVDEFLQINKDKQNTTEYLTEFIQEGIGALLAYLEKDVAYNTLTDFLIVLRVGNGEKRELPKLLNQPLKVDEIKSNTEMIL
jgi:hypothetical protein